MGFTSQIPLQATETGLFMSNVKGWRMAVNVVNIYSSSYSINAVGAG